MFASVIVCTYNRGEYLKYTLESLIKQDYSKDLYEIIVVDNNSSDNTKEIANEFVGKYKELTYELELRQGLSFARNHGIEVAKGDIVVFIDDDAIAYPDWLSNLLQPYSDEKVACVGGKINIVWQDGKQPEWYSDIFMNYFSGFDIKTNLPKEAEGICEFPYGANISFRKEPIKKLGSFDSNLGRIGKKLLAGEETLLCKKLFDNKWKIIYTPFAVVDHLIPQSRTKISYLKKYAYDGAKSSFYFQSLDSSKEELKNILVNNLHNLKENFICLFKNIYPYNQRLYFYLKVVWDYSFMVESIKKYINKIELVKK